MIIPGASDHLVEQQKQLNKLTASLFYTENRGPRKFGKVVTGKLDICVYIICKHTAGQAAKS